MKYKNGDEELYDMIKDPAQFTNLAKEGRVSFRQNEATQSTQEAAEIRLTPLRS
jgi:hypothetical protein